MASANSAVFLRRNNQVQDAIDGQNLKQALQLIEKRIKKGEDTVFLKAWKAHILFLHADDAVKQRGIQETLKLCDSEPPITDSLALEKLFQTLKRLDGHAETRSKLWEKATRAKPQDREIQLEWFFSAFESDDWKSAQKAAMSLQKNFPQKREYFWWAIALSYLLAKDEKTSESERKLFGTLAYRMASKAAADVPSDPADNWLHPRAIQTAEEVRLLLKILESQKLHFEAAKYMNSETLGLDSKIVRGEKSFLALTASNLIAAGLWEDGLAFVKAAYKVSEGDGDSMRWILREIDVWELWQLLIDSQRNINTPGITTETREFIEGYLKFMPKSRNASLASIGTISVGIEKGEATKEDLFLACKRYLDRHCQKLYVFSDLCKVIDRDRTALSQVLAYLLSGKEVGEKATIPSINALKFAYYLTISGSEGNPSKQQIEAFIANCMKIYKSSSGPGDQKPNEESSESSSTIESQPTDDLCILAAMALLRTDGTSQTQGQVPETAVIRATAILEHLLSYSPHNYEARLVLVRAYLLLGAGSLALENFSKLSVKQVQSETVAHNLYTRLATIHPHAAPPVYEGREYKALDPQASMIQSLNFYRTSDVASLKFRTRIFEEGGYVSAVDCVDYRNRTSASITRRMFALDVRRAQRLVGGDPGSRYNDLAQDTTPTIDNRIFDGFPNCEFAEKPDFEERLRAGPLPKENWLASARVTDRLFSLLRDLALRKPLPKESDLPNLQELSFSEDKSDQTEAEKEATSIHRELLEPAFFIAGSKTTSLERANKALVTVADYLESKKKDLALNDSKSSPFMVATALCLQPDVPIAPTWRYLHSTFTLLETLKVVSQLVALKVPSTTKLSKDHIQRLSTLAGEVFELVMSNTRAMKQHLSAPGVLGKLIDLVMQGDPSDRYNRDLQIALDFAMDESAVEVFVGSLMESWEEALDGALKVKHAT